MIGHPRGRNRIVARLCQRNVLLFDFRDHRRVGNLFTGGTRPARFGPATLHLAALIEVVLDESARGVLGVEVEFGPELVEFLLALLVQDEFLQGVVVTPIAHHAVIAGAQQASRVRRIIREELAAFFHIERVRKNMGEAGERFFVTGARSGRYHQIGVSQL